MSALALRVLVVDDDRWIAAVHRRFVEAAGECVVVGVAHDADETLRLASAETPDVVLLDVHLPDQSGIQVLRRIRASGLDADVLMVTADRDAEVIQQARAGGASGYLVKPFTQEQLHERLVEIRRARDRLAGLTSAGPKQSDIDEVFGAPSPSLRAALPKGLNPATADLVLEVLAEGETTAVGCSESLGLARVTARRYLEHFVETGQANARQQYGKVGRPQRFYSRA